MDEVPQIFFDDDKLLEAAARLPRGSIRRTLEPVDAAAARLFDRFRRLVASRPSDMHTLVIRVSRKPRWLALSVSAQHGVHASYRPPTEYEPEYADYARGGFTEDVSSDGLDAALRRATDDLAALALAPADLMHVNVGSVSRTVWHDWAFPATASLRALTFWMDAKEELAARAWAPDRHVDWCLPHDEAAEIRADGPGAQPETLTM